MRDEIKPPCLLCEERQVRCHATCEKYKAWKDQHEAKKADMKEKLQADIIYDGYHRGIVRKNARRKHQDEKSGRRQRGGISIK